MRVVITGANGMLARAVREHASFFGDDVIALTRTEMDITAHGAVFEGILAILPDAVINCAAYTDVDAAESNEGSCFAVNAAGVENLAAACDRTGSTFVTVSTDYVFDGENPGFYTQRDTPRPQGVYARSKREGEIRAFASYPRSIIVRSGWIFGHGGTNFLSVMPKLLSAGKRIKVISDQFGTPTFANDLARRLRELAAADLPGVYHVTNAGEGTSYYGFAEKVCERMGTDKDLLEPMSHSALNRPAPRPASSKLACLISEKLGFTPLQAWEAGLAEFLSQP